MNNINNYKSYYKIFLQRVKIAINSENGEIIAVKIISKQNTKARKTLEREIALHQCLHHENIIELKKAVEDKNFVYMMMEYAAGGELFDKIGILYIIMFILLFFPTYIKIIFILII